MSNFAVPQTRLTEAQVRHLYSPLARDRVEARQGMSYLNVSDVRRWLIRIFGIGGFSTYADQAECVSAREVPKMKDGKPIVVDGKVVLQWEVCWRVRVRLYIEQLGAEWTEYAVGSSTQPSLPEAHDMAIKTAESDALKRCAVNLGDQFGLSLYFSKGRSTVFASVLRSMVDGESVVVEDDVKAIPEDAGLAARSDVPEGVDPQTGEILHPDDPGPGDVEDMSAEHALAGADRLTQDALENLADAGVIGIPDDFWPKMATIRAYKTPATRLKHATEYKQELMRSGVRDDLAVTSPTGHSLTVGKAFDIAMAGEPK